MTTQCRVLVLCHGNINRSPLAGYLLQARRPDLAVRQAGLKNDAGGEKATRKLRDYVDLRIEECQRTGDVSMGIDLATVKINLAEHRSTKMDEDLLSWAQRVVVMDGGNLKRLDNFIRSHTELENIGTEVSWKGRSIIKLGMHHNPPLPSLRDPAFIARSAERELYNAFRAVEDSTEMLQQGQELRT